MTTRPNIPANKRSMGIKTTTKIRLKAESASQVT